jgi:methionyl-tRNA synthetase
VPEPRRFYVTTPIYYVNDRPHIGHAYSTILADALARYHRMLGAETYFLTGTDEHGQKVQDAAERRGVTPQQHCDELHGAFKDLWPELQISNDDFIRTTEPRHERVVQAWLTRLYEAGDIAATDYEGWYSTAAERFWTEKDLIDGRCPDTGQPVQKIREKNYFFRMSKYAPQLREHLRAHPGFVQPAQRQNEVLGFLDKGVEDLCISRPKARMSWGIPLPFDDGYVTYVWFDALINYVSAIGWLGDRAKFETWWPHCHHVIGKDILTTHAVYWGTMLLAMGIPLPRALIAHGWWLAGDATKMSKSVGNVVSPLDLSRVYGTDVLRYVLLREMVVGLDAQFSEAMLVRRVNSDLANDLGNLAKRVAGLVQRHFEGKVPDPGTPGPEEHALAAQCAALCEAYPGWIAELKIHTAIEETLQLVRRLNKYVTDTEPFKVVKTDPATAGRTLYTVLEGLRQVSWLLTPVMPAKCRELLLGIGAGEAGLLRDLSWGGLRPGARVSLEGGLFPRRDLPMAPTAEEAAEKPPRRPSKEERTKDSEPTPVLAFEEFLRVDLRVARVVSAEPVAGSDRLLRLILDLGGEQRQVVAGIAAQVDPAELPGRQVVVVKNLAPRKVFGVESHGMVLAVDTPGGGLALLQPDAAVTPGTRVR